MRKILFPVAFGSFYLMVYTCLATMNVWWWVVCSMFALSPLVTIWMVIKILKDGTPTSKTFDEYFYEDSELKPIS